MTTHTLFDAQLEPDAGARADAPAIHAETAGATPVELSLYDDLAAIEQGWRGFEQHADCTVFQTFDWLSTWHRNIGAREGFKPAIVVGRSDGDILFILPLAVKPGGGVRRL